MTRFNVRCKKCDKRRVLPKHPDEYSRPPKCSGCGHQEYSLSHWANRRDTKAESCNCAGYVHMTRRVWPHRRGSKYCWFRKDGSQRFEGDPDFNDTQIEEFNSQQKGNEDE